MVTSAFGPTRPIRRSDVDGAWLVVVIRPDEDQPSPTARHIDTYKVEPRHLPEDPTLIVKLVEDLRELADDLECRGWSGAWR